MLEPKKIIISTHDSLAPIRGGGAMRTLKVADEFKRQGHCVTIIAPSEGVGEVGGLSCIGCTHPENNAHKY